MEECTISAAQYAVFEARGALPDSVQQLIQKIYSEWLPTSGYEYGGGSDIEVYSDGDITSADYKSEVWVPVIKKVAKIQIN
jgi:AraC family transcriptional regulator